MVFCHFRDAENMIRRFNDDVSLHISVEYARKREHISSSRFDYNMLDSEPLSQQNADEPLRNVLELSKRFAYLIGVFLIFLFPNIDCISIFLA